MISTGHRLNLNTINCCIPGLLFKCGAGVNWSEHEICRFAVKSSLEDKCIYYNVSKEGICGCMDAQIALVENNYQINMKDK
jgi:hypothetical protein